jgi:Ca-activated chloride channel homolog
MDWESPLWLVLAAPALFFLLWVERGSVHPMDVGRRRLLLVFRGLMVLLTLVALAGPARLERGEGKSIGYVVDVSQSLGREGLERVVDEVRRMSESFGTEVEQFAVLAGRVPEVIGMEVFRGDGLEALLKRQSDNGGQTDYAAAMEIAAGRFPAGVGKEMVVVGDGFETQGLAVAQARRLMARGIKIHCVGIAGPRVNDARVVSFVPSRNRVQEGATVELKALVEATMDAALSVKLYENGVEVDKRALELKAGIAREVVFDRTAGQRDIFGYRVVIEGMGGFEDLLPGNNEGLAVVDVRGKMRLLYLEADQVEGQYLPRAMEKEGIDLDWRSASMAPKRVDELAGYDAVILSEVSADELGEAAMLAIREYVDTVGGGLVMLGGPRSFGVGGYFKTPLEEVLPVRLRAPDEEEKQSAAVALVLDRSGSMAGEKLEMAKGAAIATAEVLGRNDQLGVYAFDSEAKVVSPMSRLTSTSVVSGQISALSAGGGTNLEPAFMQAREALRRAKAKVKHMIILTDGQTSGSGYEGLAGQCRAEGMTVSTVALGEGAHSGLLQAVAVAGGGQSYRTLEPEGITRIFTQDTLMHTGRMIREEPFDAKVEEKHPMLVGLEPWDAPPLLGYVKTVRRASAQVPLVTDTGDPLLAHWRFGLGKVTAFTSDAKSRWASLWVSRWSSYGVFWSQVLRETARPPQGGRMDLTAEMVEGEGRISVDLRANGEVEMNEGGVEAEIFRMSSGSAPGAMLQKVAERLPLSATGPGLFEGKFQPDQPGVYLVRAHAGSETASAGLVYQTATEASLGRVNEGVLRELAEISGGTLLEEGETPALTAVPDPHPREWWPMIAGLLLVLAAGDLLTRRWEQVVGIAESLKMRS